MVEYSRVDRCHLLLTAEITYRTSLSVILNAVLTTCGRHCVDSLTENQFTSAWAAFTSLETGSGGYWSSILQYAVRYKYRYAWTFRIAFHRSLTASGAWAALRLLPALRPFRLQENAIIETEFKNHGYCAWVTLWSKYVRAVMWDPILHECYLHCMHLIPNMVKMVWWRSVGRNMSSRWI